MQRILSIIGGLVLLCGLACVCFVGLGAILPKPPPGTNSVAKATPPKGQSGGTTNVETPAEAAKTYKIGDTVPVGEVGWKIMQVKDEGQTLKSDNQFIASKKTAGKFLRVTFVVGNGGKEPKSFTGLELKDNQERRFKEYPEALFFIDQSLQCSFKQLSPGVPVQCQAIYELPADAKGLVANPGDLDIFGMAEAIINLE